MSEKIETASLDHRKTETGSRETTLSHGDRFSVELVEAEDEWYLNVEHEEEDVPVSYHDVETFSYKVSDDKAIPHKIVVDMEEWNL